MFFTKFTLLLVLTLIPTFGFCANTDIQPNPSEVVVKIQVVRNPPSFHQPWQNIGHRSANATGVIVEGRRILTNAHVVSNSVFIHVQRAGKTEKFPAEVEFFDHASDLALLKVDAADFFKDVTSLPFGKLPNVRDKVAVYGFPDGGDKLSITEGVVSRIEHISYAYSGAFLLACQIDAPINSGNSGGPVIYENQVAGIAFQGMNYNYENIGYMIPSPVVEQFLEDVKDGSVQGIPDLGITMQKLESPYLRKYFHLTGNENGALIIKILPGSPGEGILNNEDVILTVDEEDVAYDGTIAFRKDQRTYFGYLIQKKQLGDSVRLVIKRAGQIKEVTVPLTQPVGFAKLVPLKYEEKPRYYILGGLVFQPLSLNYLYEFGGGVNWAQNAPVELTNYHVNGELDFQGKEIVFLSEVLADKVNVGYHELGDNIVQSVNGEKIDNFKHFIELVENGASEYLDIVVSRGTKILLDRKTMVDSTEKIIKKYSIKSARNL
ncbi:MAG: trypsin-like peptidase domain-containing protein [Proteobacteria bacterium]|nr:trypsin-like peptidase domain-containing protein [Pseudomonadota bacterium]